MSAAKLNQTEAMIRSVSIDALLLHRESVAAQIAVVQAAYVALEQIHTAAGVRQDSCFDVPWRSPAMDIKAFDKNAWRMLIEKAGVFSCMSSLKRKKWEDSLERGDFPPLTRESIEATIADLLAGREQMYVEAVRECAEKITAKYQRNTPCEFTPKFILTYFADSWMGGLPSPRIGGSAEKLDDLTRVLCLLQGKPVPDNTTSVYMRSDAARNRGECFAENEYLRWKWHKNGNAHVEFKSAEDVTKLNRILAAEGPRDLRPPSRREREAQGGAAA